MNLRRTRPTRRAFPGHSTRFVQPRDGVNGRTNRCEHQRRRSWRLLSRSGANSKNMKQNIAVEEFLAGRRVVIAKFVTHRHKEVQNKAKKVVGVVNL